MYSSYYKSVWCKCVCVYTHTHAYTHMRPIKDKNNLLLKAKAADRQYFVSVPQTPISTRQSIRDQEVLAHAMGFITEEGL